MMGVGMIQIQFTGIQQSRFIMMRWSLTYIKFDFQILPTWVLSSSLLSLIDFSLTHILIISIIFLILGNVLNLALDLLYKES